MYPYTKPSDHETEKIKIQNYLHHSDIRSITIKFYVVNIFQLNSNICRYTL